MHKAAALWAAVVLLGLAAVSVQGADSNPRDLEGNYLYKVTTVRAATGSLSDLLDWLATRRKEAPFIMRHSQGDQWDLMLITPLETWAAYATRIRPIALPDRFVAFEEDHFAWGPRLPALREAYDDNAFFHIEMFNAAPGKGDVLLEQRRMENAYLAATGQTTNMIFRRAAGSDVDVFTIGFHEDFEAFAAPGRFSDQNKEAAAVAAGFKDRADISFYLRSLLSSHHDTLAVKVQ